MSALDVARGLLTQFGTLQELAGREVAEVAGVRGVGRAKAVRLAAAFEITRRLRSRNGHARPVLSSPEQVFARYAPLMEDLKKEIFRLALLDAQNGLLRDVVVSEGTLSASLVHPREVFKPAILESAASIILLHNHPSGDPTPSREDLRLTRQLVECSKLLDLRIHDHVIIGRERFISLAQRGEPAEEGESMKIQGVGHVVLKVRDLDRVGGLLCGRARAQGGGPAPGPHGVLLGGPESPRPRRHGRRADAPSPPDKAVGLAHVALKIGDSLDLLREAKALLESHAVPIRGIRDHVVSQSIYCEDPDGNDVELFVDGDPAIWAQDPSTVATTGPLVLS